MTKQSLLGFGHRVWVPVFQFFGAFPLLLFINEAVSSILWILLVVFVIYTYFLVWMVALRVGESDSAAIDRALEDVVLDNTISRGVALAIRTRLVDKVITEETAARYEGRLGIPFSIALLASPLWSGSWWTALLGIAFGLMVVSEFRRRKMEERKRENASSVDGH